MVISLFRSSVPRAFALDSINKIIQSPIKVQIKLQNIGTCLLAAQLYYYTQTSIKSLKSVPSYDGKSTANHQKVVGKNAVSYQKVIGKNVSLFPDKVSDYAEKED